MNIGLYGDSTQAGVSVYSGVVSQAQWTPAKVLQMMLDHEYGQGVHTVSNYGIGGSTLWQAMSTGLYAGQPLTTHIAAQSDDIVVLNFGINDAFIPGYTPAAHKANYASVKSSVEGLGKVFVYESPNPLNTVHDSLVGANDAAVKTISGVKNMDTYGQIKNYYPQWQSHLSDGIHPNSIMYFWVGDYLFKTIDPLL